MNEFSFDKDQSMLITICIWEKWCMFANKWHFGYRLASANSTMWYSNVESFFVIIHTESISSVILWTIHWNHWINSVPMNHSDWQFQNCPWRIHEAYSSFIWLDINKCWITKTFSSHEFLNNIHEVPRSMKIYRRLLHYQITVWFHQTQLINKQKSMPQNKFTSIIYI